MPEYLPLADAAVVARWLAEQKARGTLPYLDATVSSGVRVCQAAQQHGLDIAGSLMRLGSEPFTDARARIIRETGVQVFCSYHLAEVGRLGAPCLMPAAVDEVHIMTDKIALLQRERLAGGGRVGALFCSTLHPAVPKMMLNVELGDYGVLGPRPCGCPYEQLGFHQHLYTIRSYEKLTSEGMHFVGTELMRLIEEVLPQRFGGSATDYQLLEEEIEGLPKVSLLVSPSVGDIDEALVVRVALETLGSAHGADKMANVWRHADTLRVARREPYATRAAKILPLHVTSGER
jgi:phenylacetate-coenzyme A ligase PaaK-like adenylate-forming protein